MKKWGRRSDAIKKEREGRKAGSADQQAGEKEEAFSHRGVRGGMIPQ